MVSFYSKEELKKLGIKEIGENVFISKKASIYSPEKIKIGNNVRIDDFCILSGDIEIGDYVHIAAYVALYGKYGIKIGDFCGCSARCTIYSATDDFSGEYSLDEKIYDRLKEKEQIMLNAIENGILEESCSTQEDLDIIFNKLNI